MPKCGCQSVYNRVRDTIFIKSIDTKVYTAELETQKIWTWNVWTESHER